MDATADAIRDYAIQRTHEAWVEKQPYFLARLSPELQARGVNYKEVIGPRPLKRFLEEEAASHLRVVSHPLKRNMIGLIPAGEHYEFASQIINSEDESTGVRQVEPLAHERAGKKPNGRFIVMAFLDLLAELDPSDLDKVNLPTSILAKLVRRR